MTKPLSFIIFLCLLALCSSVCTKSRVRRSWYTLSAAERDLWVEAMQIIKNNGIYDQFVEVHTSGKNSFFAHGHSGFLPWHRWYIYIFENQLRKLGKRFECITIPYWPAELDAGHESKSQMFTPEWFGSNKTDPETFCVTDGPFAKWMTTDQSCIRRTFLPIYGYVGEAEVMSIIANSPTYGVDQTGFRSKFEGSPHAAPHNFVGAGGGHMGTMLSTNDPIFFLHHSNIDRIWALWQDCHDFDKMGNVRELPRAAYERTTKDIDGLFDVMPYYWDRIEDLHPFFKNNKTITPRDVYFINNDVLDYTYEPGDRLRGLLDYTYDGCKWDWFAADHLLPRYHIDKRSLDEVSFNESVINAIDKRSGQDATHKNPAAEESLLKATRKIVNRYNIDSKKQEDDPAREALMKAIRKISDSQDLRELTNRGFSSRANEPYADPFWDKKKHQVVYRFADSRVQKAYEEILKHDPSPYVPKHHQLQLLAVRECQIYGGKPHSSEEWIIMQRMSSQSEVFAPVCKFQYK